MSNVITNNVHSQREIEIKSGFELITYIRKAIIRAVRVINNNRVVNLVR
jgi:hypothetical protein